MRTTKDPMIAACGISCGDCNLYCAPTDEEAAESLVSWFKKEGWLTPAEGAAEVMCRGPYCQGCTGDPKVQWSSDCWIRQCCVEDRGLQYCSECRRFPCDPLTDWSRQNARYTVAFNRLVSMRHSQSVLFYVYLNEVQGPYTKAELHALGKAGTIDPFTQICLAGTDAWMSFFACKEAQ